MPRAVAALALVACRGPEDDETGGPGPGTEETDLPPAELATVYVNEVIAQNTSGLQDESGYYPDWVELHNPGDEPVDLSGWWMSDDRADPFSWQVPDGVEIAAGGWLVVFCDDDEAEGDLHASFHLAVEGGEDVALFGPNVLDNPLVDALEDYTVQLPDVSLARTPDGGATWVQDLTATPGTANGDGS